MNDSKWPTGCTLTFALFCIGGLAGSALGRFADGWRGQLFGASSGAIIGLILGELISGIVVIAGDRKKSMNASIDKSVDAASADKNACIRVRRISSFVDRARSYHIQLDGHEIVRLRAGETVEIRIPSGRHTIVAKIDWCGSPEIAFEVAPGSTLDFECASNLRGFRILLGVVYATFLQDQYLTLKPVS